MIQQSSGGPLVVLTSINEMKPGEGRVQSRVEVMEVRGSRDYSCNDQSMNRLDFDDRLIVSVTFQAKMSNIS